MLLPVNMAQHFYSNQFHLYSAFTNGHFNNKQCYRTIKNLEINVKKQNINLSLTSKPDAMLERINLSDATQTRNLEGNQTRKETHRHQTLHNLTSITGCYTVKKRSLLGAKLFMAIADPKTIMAKPFCNNCSRKLSSWFL